jgi:hypothetical protein
MKRNHAVQDYPINLIIVKYKQLQKKKLKK